MKLLLISKKNLFKNKISAGLTFSSSVLAVSCLILLFAINETGKKEIVKDIKGGGNLNKVYLDPRVFTEKGFEGEVKGILSPVDLRLIKNNCPQVKEIGFYTVTEIDEMGIGNRQYSDVGSLLLNIYGLFPKICGVPPASIKAMDMKIKEGRFINKTDMLYRRRVCVLGGEVARFIGQKKLIGKEIITKNPNGKFTIIGILEKKMSFFTALPQEIVWELLPKNDGNKPIEPIEPNFKASRKYNALETNNSIYIPFTTWQDFVKEKDLSVISSGGISLECTSINKSLYSSSSFPERTWILIKIDTPFEIEEEKLIKDKEDLRVFGIFYTPIPEGIKEPLDKIRKVLCKKYGDDSFFLFEYLGSLRNELKDQIEESNKLLMITMLFSLLFSGIILTSMMLLSVHKRVNEIGIRRAFGARKKDIFWQFLAEGVILYSVGIIIGIFAGLLISYLVIVKIICWEFSVPIFGIIISSVFVFLVGILSSLYPALKAAKIPPAVAVKYE